MTVSHSSIIRFSTVTISLFSILSLTDSAYGAILNGDFNNELDNWAISGDVSIFEGQALLTTASATTNNNEVTNIASLETFLGVEPFALDPSNGFGAFEGSAIKQTFTAIAGDELELSWNFLTNETGNPIISNNDTAFLTLVNTGNNSSNVIKLADTNSSLISSSNSLGFVDETGVNNFSTSLTPGEYILGFAVVDDTDALVSSALLIDNVQIVNDPDPKPIPEPATMIGLLTTVLLGSRVGIHLKKPNQ